MALDKESPNVAYRLGRLFAVLEKAQKDAIPGANTTIKDRYYGSGIGDSERCISPIGPVGPASPPKGGIWI